MDGNNSNSEDETKFCKFVLLIQKSVDPEGIIYQIKTKTQGIPDSEVILIIDAWLDQFKQAWQKPIRDNLFFGGKGPSND